jgi:hypothetical protein
MQPVLYQIPSPPVATPEIEIETTEAEDMKLRDDDKNWLKGEIAGEVATAVSKEIDKFNPHGARRVAHFIHEWGLAGTIIMGFLALLAFGAAAVYQATARVEKQSAFQTRTEIRLDNIEKILKDIRGDLAKQSVINHAALPLADFKATLPDLSSAIATAKQQNAKVPAQVMGDLQYKLSASVDAPDFWSAAAQFISYRSQNSIPDFESLASSSLPNCSDREPEPMELTISAEDEKNWKRGEVRDASAPTDANGSKMKSALYENCAFVLDSPEDAARISGLWERAYILTFRHCQIIYRGGPIALLTPHPKPSFITGKGPTRTDVYVFWGQTLRFDNCLFALVINSRPSNEGQSLTHQLLAQSGPVLTVQTVAKS